MSCILHIETSTAVCSVALSSDGQVIDQYADLSGANHAEKLPEFFDQALSFADSHALPLDAVAVSSGPGSYTGLRIGVSLAKGVCMARDLKLISVPTLQLLAVPLLLHEEIEPDALLCPMIDARRMEVYAAIYDRRLKMLREASADVVDENTYSQWLEDHTVYFFGNGAAKCKTVIAHPNARFIDDIHPLAKWMMPIAERKLLQGETEDVAYFTPFYLKDFVAKQAKKLI